MQKWMGSRLTDILVTHRCQGHRASYPAQLADRLSRVLSFASYVVHYHFMGTGSTAVAALNAGRNSLCVEIEPEYIKLAYGALEKESLKPKYAGATRSSICSIGF